MAVTSQDNTVSLAAARGSLAAMVRPRLALIPPVFALACSFDGAGMLSISSTSVDTGPGSEGETAGSSEASATEVDVPTTGIDGTSTGLTPTSTTAVGPTSEPSDDSTSTTGASCGDGVREAGEACDGADLGGQGCGDFGLVDGALACAGDCSIDLAGCLPAPVCGDGVADAGEDCDGADLGAQTCEGLMFDLGTLGCGGDCVFDTSECVDAPEDWYDVAFLNRRKLTIPAAGVAGALEDFPVVITTTDGAVLGDLMPADGLVFATPDKQKLSHEVVYTGGDRLVVWVELKSLVDGADTEFYVYYGDPESSNTADPAGTWSNGFLAVWHLDEVIADEMETGKLADATGKEHTGTQHDGKSQGFASCRVGRCHELGTDDWIEVDKDADFNSMDDAHASVSAWVYSFQMNSQPHAIFSKSNPNMPEHGHMMFGMLAHNAGNKLGFEQSGAGVMFGTKNIPSSQWRHVVWSQTRDFMGTAERWQIFLDGELEAEGNFTGTKAANAQVVRLGGPTIGSVFPANFQGRLDEVQVANADRSAAWVTTTFNNQRDPAMFTLIGAEESL